MSGSGAEAEDADLAEIVGEARSRYPRYKSGACGSGDGGRYGGVGVGGRYIIGYVREEVERKTRGTREDQAYNWRRSN